MGIYLEGLVFGIILLPNVPVGDHGVLGERHRHVRDGVHEKRAYAPSLLLHRRRRIEGDIIINIKYKIMC